MHIMCSSLPSPRQARQASLGTMLNDLLLELDDLAQRNNELVERATAAKAKLRDTRALEKAIHETKGKKLSKEKDDRPEEEDDDDYELPDRRARASSCIIPPFMQPHIGASRSVESLLPSPLPRSDLTLAHQRDQSRSSERPLSGMRNRAMTLPDLHKPLPPTPRTPQWLLETPGPYSYVKETDFLHDHSNFFASLDDGTALLLDNMALEPGTPTTRLPFVPGQSYTRLQRRPTNEDINKPATTILPVRSSSRQPPPLPAQPLDTQLPPNTASTTPIIETTSSPAQTAPPALPTQSPSKRLRKKFEDYLPHKMLTQKPKHERSRTLSPDRARSTNRLLTKRAKSTVDLRRQEKKSVKFAPTSSAPY